ncbi:MAG: hypothetical protein AB1546_00790 [bacterium]
MTTKEKIIKTLDDLPEDKLSEILEFVEDFKKKNAAGKSGGKWDRFFGILSDEDAEAMLAVIEETCERIDYD